MALTLDLCLALYVVATFSCPNRVYFSGFETLDDDAMRRLVDRVMLYGAMEFASLLVLYALIKWRFNMNVFYHLAFVLETHALNVQGKMVFFLIFILNFNLAHYGTCVHDTHTRFRHL